MDTPTPIQVDLGRIAQDLQIRRVQVESVVLLLDEGNTVPFITRYRKERTGNLNEVAIREIQVRVGRLRELAERKETILKTIEAQGKLTDELRAAVRGADNAKRLEDLYLPYKPKKKTKASEAREKGLEPLALAVWNRDETLTDLPAAAQGYLNPEKELETVEKVLEGVGHILSEAVSELATIRDAVRRVVWRTGKIVTTKTEIPEGEGLEYRDYFNYSEPVAHIPPHRVLAINRGDKEGPLKVKLEVPRPDLEAATFGQLPLEGHPHADFFAKAALDALDRLLLPSMEREVRRDLTEIAERHAVEVFARNLRSLLLQPPIPKQVVLAIDPGFRTGCKLAVLDGHGNLLDQGVIHPHPPQNRRHEAKQYLKDLVGKHKVGVVAIGNGTACRETEELIAELIAEGTHFHQNPQATAPETPAAPTSPSEAAAPATPPGEETVPSAESTPTAADHHAGAESQPPDAGPAGETQAGETQAAQEQAGEAHAAQDHAAQDHAVEAHAAQEHAGEAHAAQDQPESETAGDAGATGEGSGEHATPMADENGSSEAEPVLPPISGGAPDSTSEPGENAPPSSPVEAASPEAESPQVNPPEAAGQPQDPAPEPTSAEHHNLVAEASSSEAPASSPTAEPVQVPDAHAEQEAAAATTGDEPATAPEAHADAPEVDRSGENGSDSTEAPDSAPTASAPTASGSPAPAAPAGPSLGLTAPPKGAPSGSGSKPSQPRPPRPRPVPPPPGPHPADALVALLAYVIVNEAGASVYSTSPVGREEFPEFDATLRSAISIGRRLQDPLSELVKIEPQNIGVGLYQHDVNPKQLKESLESVIESCVNFVGVDLNTASVPLLRHVSGLNQLTARRVVDRRKEKGPFASREQLNEVDGIGPITFTQAAGFLKIPGGDAPFDRTWIHPESYSVAEQVLQKLEFGPDVILNRDQLPALHSKLDEVDLPAMARDLQVGEPTLHDIFEALARPERDPRDDLPKPIFKKGVLKLEDLSSGMELKGTVLNVVDFGAFVDIGLKDSGLVHISQLANRYIKSPHDVVSVGDVVTVWVMGVDQERKRVSLTMVKPGTERPRGGPGGPGGPGGGGGRRAQGEGREGGERRGGGVRPPRREAGPGGPRREGTAPQPAGAGAPGGGEPAARRPPDRPGQGGRGPEGQGGPGRGPGGPQRGGPGRGTGPRPPQGQGQSGGPQGRFERAQAPRQPTRPGKPAPPPPPLSKDALAGSVPLRTFGQLKQLWQARTEDSPADEPGSPPAEPQAQTPPPSSPPVSPEASSTPAPEGSPQHEPNPDPQPMSDQGSN